MLGDVARHVASARAVLERESNFLSSLRSLCTTSQLIEPLRELAHTSDSLAQELWHQSFSVAWTALSSQQQAALVRPMVSLLSAPYHKRQLQVQAAAGYRLNVVQHLLKAFTSARPQVTNYIVDRERKKK